MYEGAGWSTRAWGAGAFGVFRRASLRDPGGGLLLRWLGWLRTAGRGWPTWSGLHAQVISLGVGARCVYVSNKTEEGVV